MEHFSKVADMDVSELQSTIEEFSERFGELPLRTSYEGSSHTEVEDILFRGPDLWIGYDLLQLQNEIQCYSYPNWFDIETVAWYAMEVFKGVEGTQLGRVIVTRLPAGGKIYEHKDEGDAAEHYDRFHLVIKGGEGDIFHSSGESVTMNTGELWQVDNMNNHSVENNMTEERVHMVLDIQRN